MHRTQIEICSNLEAYVCLDNKCNFSNEKKKQPIFFVSDPSIPLMGPSFRQNFRKTCFYMRRHVPVALFTSPEKTQSKSKYRRFAMVLLAFLCEQIFCFWYFIESCLLFVCCCTSRRVFPHFLWSKQLFRWCWPASIRTNISLNTFLQNNFSIVYF